MIATQIIEKLKKRIKESPEGSLKVISKNNRVQYYVYYKGKTKYIRKNETKLISELAQKYYDKKVLKIILKKNFSKTEIDQVYYSMGETNKFVEPILETNMEKLNKWKEIPYSQPTFVSNQNYLYSKNYEKLRSKSEKLISDMLYDNKIIYKYECPLYLKGYGTIYPDFTFYDPISDEEIYWEHFGIMDDIEYANRTLNKIEHYASNGIYIGERLIVTFESSKIQLNIQIVNQYIKKYLQFNC